MGGVIPPIIGMPVMVGIPIIESIIPPIMGIMAALISIFPALWPQSRVARL